MKKGEIILEIPKQKKKKGRAQSGREQGKACIFLRSGSCYFHFMVSNEQLWVLLTCGNYQEMSPQTFNLEEQWVHWGENRDDRLRGQFITWNFCNSGNILGWNFRKATRSLRHRFMHIVWSITYRAYLTDWEANRYELMWKFFWLHFFLLLYLINFLKIQVTSLSYNKYWILIGKTNLKKDFLNLWIYSETPEALQP